MEPGGIILLLAEKPQSSRRFAFTLYLLHCMLSFLWCAWLQASDLPADTRCVSCCKHAIVCGYLCVDNIHVHVIQF